jgi:hypothetical protein
MKQGLQNEIQASINSITRFLGFTALILIIISVTCRLVYNDSMHDYLKRILEYFYVDQEQNIPTFFSSFLLLLSSAILAIIAKLEKDNRSTSALKWMVLSICFLYLSIDESVSLHEKLIFPMRNMLPGKLSHGIFYYTWVIPGMIFILFFAAFFADFILKLNPKIRFYFITSAIIYVSGGLGLELIGGYLYELNQRTIGYSMLTTVEEGMEMAGIIVFIYGLLIYISEKYQSVIFIFTSSGLQKSSLKQKTEDV